MGFLDSSSSSNTTKNFITTTTTSKVGDIGVTGNQAVDLVSQIRGINADTQKANQNTYSMFAGNTAGIVNNSLGFAGGVVNSSFSDINHARMNNNDAFATESSMLSNTLATGSKTLSDTLATGAKQSASVIQGAFNQLSNSTGNLSSTTAKLGTYALIAIALVFVFKGKM